MIAAADGGFHLELGTLGEWVAGLATLAAVIVALWLGWREGRWRRLDELPRLYDRAELVIPNLQLTTGMGHFEVVNQSPMLVRDVDVVGIYLNGVRRFPPRIDRLPPNSRATTSDPITHQPEAWKTNGSYVLFGGFEFDFTDDAGRRWRRAGDDVYLRTSRLFSSRWRRRDGHMASDPHITRLPLAVQHDEE